ncbi:hypothetical protein GCM10007962_30570 [Yeosuana aromativorans]|uniref:Sialidase domain-containing protein n=2 Tax=Yeosuana aromativorans TaxID=288019 RepID=A0A8J3BSF2_9FLAO|nr:hypothetical protein GCM10007962_30570 [Yeosuana aromativorans]
MCLVSSYAQQLDENVYDLAKYYPNIPNAKLIYVGENPMNEASVQVFEDGDIRIFHTDQRYSKKVMMQESLDNGYSYLESRKVFSDSLISQYPRKTLLDDKGNLHLLVFKEKVLAVYHSVSSDKGETWSPLKFVTNGRIGSIRAFIQTNSGRLIFAYHRHVVSKGTLPTGSCYTTAVYSDDYGKTWIESDSRITAPVFNDYNGNNYGMVEPSIVQMKDGSIKMLSRTQTGYLYESTSVNNGETWSEGVASIFRSSNSPAHIFRLPNDDLVLTYCNTVDSDIGTFGKIYTNRDILTMAISKDDGETWKGFREIVRMPSRNNQANIPRGDRGLSYPDLGVTKEGKIILVSGQGEYGGGRVKFLIDPTWLDETTVYDDFTNGLEKWSCYSFVKLGLFPERELGAKVIYDDTAINRKALLVNKEEGDLFADGAVLNFPMGKSGELTTRIKFNENTKGISFSLTDHYRYPNDCGGDTSAMFSDQLKCQKTYFFKPNEWYNVKLVWDVDRRFCDMFVNNTRYKRLKMQNYTGTGISYIRFRNLAKTENSSDSGVKIDWIKIQI